MEQFLRRFMQPSRTRYTVGVHSSGPGSQRPDGLTNAMVALWHEYGVRNATGGWRIPPRSFVRSTVAIHRDKYKRMLHRLARLVAMDSITHDQALQLVAMEMQNDMVRRIDAGIDPPLAQETIDRKGSSKPLIDTGHLKQSITHRKKRR